MKVLKSGTNKLLSLKQIEVDIKDIISVKNLEVYIKVNKIAQVPQVTVSNIKEGMFTFISNIDCIVNWIVVETNDDNMSDYMKWHPIF